MVVPWMLWGTDALGHRVYMDGPRMLWGTDAIVVDVYILMHGLWMLWGTDGVTADVDVVGGIDSLELDALIRELCRGNADFLCPGGTELAPTAGSKVPLKP